MAVRTRKRRKTDAYNAGVSDYTDWLHGNIGITSIKITLKDFMSNWLEKVVALNVKPNFLQEYKFQFEHYISLKLGNEKVQSITPVVLDKFMRKLSS